MSEREQEVHPAPDRARPARLARGEQPEHEAGDQQRTVRHGKDQEIAQHGRDSVGQDRPDGHGPSADLASALGYATSAPAWQRTDPSPCPRVTISPVPTIEPYGPRPGALDVNDAWIADRMKHIEASGIRKAFDMAKAMKDPINLSIGLPDFDVADPVKAAAIDAIEHGLNAYTVTQGIPELRGKIQAAVDAEFRHADRQVLITSGTSGALLLALCCVVNPGDEVIIFDPYFVMYATSSPWPAGRRCWSTPTPTSASTSTRSPPRSRRGPSASSSTARPTRPASVASADEMQAPGRALPRAGRPPDQRRGLSRLLLRHPFATPATWNEDVLVVDGFSKAHGMTGWRLGYAHGPARLIQEMAKLQQFSFVCAPSIVQYAGVVALDQDLTAQVDAYRRKRDAVVAALGDDFRARHARRRLLRLPPRPLGHRDRVRRRGDPPQPPDHPRQRLQPPRHATSGSPTPSTTRPSPGLSARKSSRETARIEPGRRQSIGSPVERSHSSRGLAAAAASRRRTPRARAWPGLAPERDQPVQVLGEQRLGVEPEAGEDLGPIDPVSPGRRSWKRPSRRTNQRTSSGSSPTNEVFEHAGLLVVVLLRPKVEGPARLPTSTTSSGGPAT